jgi:type II secretory pathway component PulC
VAVLATNRFGRQITSTRWEFSRQALMNYYQELLDDPIRMVAVYDSLKPRYDSQQKISGYQLDVEGEAEFFNNVGLHPGEIVTKVNSMPMTNRRRAEFFINEFVNQRANAFVLDVESDGTMQRRIYQVY